MTASQSSSDSSSSGRKRPMPALLTRTRGAPRSRLTNVANRSTAAGSDTSHGIPIASTPAAQKSPTVRRTFVSLRAQIATRAPAPPSVIAIARPMPSVAPVTTAREPARSMAGQIYEGTGTGWRFGRWRRRHGAPAPGVAHELGDDTGVGGLDWRGGLRGTARRGVGRGAAGRVLARRHGRRREGGAGGGERGGAPPRRAARPYRTGGARARVWVRVHARWPGPHQQPRRARRDPHRGRVPGRSPLPGGPGGG